MPKAWCLSVSGAFFAASVLSSCQPTKPDVVFVSVEIPDFDRVETLIGQLNPESQSAEWITVEAGGVHRVHSRAFLIDGVVVEATYFPDTKELGVSIYGDGATSTEEVVDVATSLCRATSVKGYAVREFTSSTSFGVLKVCEPRATSPGSGLAK
jgi:hypothetical protein